MSTAQARARAASRAFLAAFCPGDELRDGADATEDCAAPAAVHAVRVAPALAIGPEARALLQHAQRDHMRIRINDELTTTITNSVHCTTLVDMRTGAPYRLPLAALANALSAIGAQYTMQRFSKIVIRYGPSMRTTQLCFATGKVLEPGRSSFATKRALLYALVDLMRRAGLTTVGIGTRACQNLVATGVLTFTVRLRLLQLRHSEGDYVTYDPTLFPGAIIRHPLLIDLITADDAEPADDEDERDSARSAPAPRGGAPYVYPGPRDCAADEVLDDPEAERAAAAYIYELMLRHGADASDPQRVRALVDEMLSAQRKKKIVALLFGVGVVILGGTKNVRMLRRANTFMYEMADSCRDTPENRALEAELLRARGLPVPAELAGPGAPRRGRKRKAEAAV